MLIFSILKNKIKTRWEAEWIQLYFNHTEGEKAKGRTNLNNSWTHCLPVYFLSWLRLSGRELQPTPELFLYILICLVVDVSSNFETILDVSCQWANEEMCSCCWEWEFPYGKRTSNYGNGEGKKEPCKGGLELKASVWTHDFIYMFPYGYIYTHLHAYVYIYTYTCAHKYVYMYIYLCVYVYYICIYTCKYMYFFLVLSTERS